LATCGVALLYLIAATPKFTAEADLVIELKAPLGDAATVSTIVDSQIGIIKSESVARAVIQKLDLLKDPEFVGRNSVLRTLLRSIGLIKPETEASVMQRVVDSFQRRLSAKRIGLTYLVATTFDSADPNRAAQILNTLAETYIALQMDAKYSSTLRDETWIKGRLNELSARASAAQKALEDYYKNKTNTADSANTADALLAAAESSSSAYDNFRHALRQMEATRQQSLPVFEARLVTDATPPPRASSPKSGIILGMSAIAGVLLGIAIGIVRDLSDRGVRASGQLCKDLQLTCIAVVPMVGSQATWRKTTALLSGLAQRLPTKSAPPKKPALPARLGPASVPIPLDGDRLSRRTVSNPASTDRPTSRNIVRTEIPIWTIANAPQSPFTESFVEIKLAIDAMNRNGKRNQVIGITSTQANEGKSTVAAALALLIAHTGARAILLDCNLRNRSLSATLAPGAAGGMLDVMNGAASASATTWIDPASQLAFLPAGSSSRPLYVSDVLASPRLDKLFQSLREAYDYIIVDLPAVAPSADVRAAAHLVDSFILVVEWKRTSDEIAERALSVCRDLDEIMLGVTVNKAELPDVEAC